MKQRLYSILTCLTIAFAVLICSPHKALALDLTNGLMYAVPTPGGHAPVINGSTNGWDLSGSEPIWATNQTAKLMHGEMAVEYDNDALYLAATVTLPNRKLLNVNGPADPFWAGDMVELRLSSDPTMAFPIDPTDAVKASNRVCHLSLWKNTQTGKTYINIAYGVKLNLGSVLNPLGSAIAVTDTDSGYVLTARIPWSALNVPGGKNPFAAGQRMTATMSVHWGFDYQIPMLFIHNPGSFAFAHPDTWGQLTLNAGGHVKPGHGTMEEAVLDSQPKTVGVPVVVDVPDAGKLSVNIVGSHGEVLRELCGGIDVQAGKFTVSWDGRDQWGLPLAPGAYHWAAYVSHGLKAHYVGTVGMSGNPPTNTADGTGGWGGDHGLPTSVAADSTGIYFAWDGSEAQAKTVKVDYTGTTLWRKSPFIGGGWAPVNSLATNGKYLFAAWPGPILSRQDIVTGALAPFEISSGSATSYVPIATGTPDTPVQKTCDGLAATKTEVFASVYLQNKIQVLDSESGAQTRSLDCPSPRGLAFDFHGNLFAVSFGADGTGKVFEFKGANGPAIPIVIDGLVAPFGVALDAEGNLHVTDDGASQQVKTFSSTGKLISTVGKLGGRAWLGAYDQRALLNPTGICSDQQGGILVAETSIPKIFDRIDAASGHILKQWFGAPAYGVSNVPDPDNPLTCYYPFEPRGFGRATVHPPSITGDPTAYWDLQQAGIDGVGNLFGDMTMVQILANGKKYMISDTAPHGVCLIDGDMMRPVGHINVVPAYLRSNTTHKSYIEIWIDKNGDNKPEPDEITTMFTLNGQSLPSLSSGLGSMWLDDSGSAYFPAADSVVKIPSDGFEANGAIDWDVNKMTTIVPVVLASELGGGVYSNVRSGMGGVRVDSKGNVLTCLTVGVPGLTPDLAKKIAAMYPDVPQSKWCAYATPLLAKKMQDGLGHTAGPNAVKFAKYGPDGKLIWIAGRKATAAPEPGEMYHFWGLAGIVGDDYVVGASEWGPMYVYTADGFYVDALMNDPNQLAPPGPYTFGSETFGGRIQAFPKLGQVWAYNQGGIYQVVGFDNKLHVEGEHRIFGTVALDKVYGDEAVEVAQSPLSLVRINNPADIEKGWTNVPETDIAHAGVPLAQVKLGYDNSNVYALYHVNHPTPVVNVADDLRLAFKGGDAVALDLGPAGDRQGPELGDIRLLAAQIGGSQHLIAMKPITNLDKSPDDYTTPAGGTKHFEFVGDVPGGSATFKLDADGQGYSDLITVPRSFLELQVVSGSPLKGDVEVLLSGQGSRGTQTLSRNPYFAAGHSQTTMVDDTPTESWLYPQFWGDVTVR